MSSSRTASATSLTSPPSPALDAKSLCVLVWHYHDDDLPGPTAAVALSLAGLPLRNGEAKLEHFRIDEDHSNGFTAWKRIGSPQQPGPAQYGQLEQAAQLSTLGPPEKSALRTGR